MAARSTIKIQPKMKIKNSKFLAGVGSLGTFALAAAGLAILSSQAQAASITDISNITTGTLYGVAGPFVGNDNDGSVLDGQLDGILLGDWSYDESNKSDSPGNGVFTSNPGDPTGTLTFDDPMFGYFAVSLKTSNAYSLYVFYGGVSGTDDGIKSFDFTTVGVETNSHGEGKDLSHASYISYSGPGPGDGPGVPDGGTTLLSLGVSLLGLGGLRRFLKAKA